MIVLDSCFPSTSVAVEHIDLGKGTATMIRVTWEYMVREFNVQDSGKILLVEEFLNEVGKDGWELVSVATTPTENFTHLVYLKRGTALAERVDLLPPPKL
jgi:hypothetical protein